ncbi:MAG: PilZ domain-containing protein, partial [Allosphingosinicella sp.]
MKVRDWEETLAVPAEQGGDEDGATDERRREPRYDCAGLKIIIRQRRGLGIIHLQNISKSGAHGLTDMPLAVGALVFLELKKARFFAATVNWTERLAIGVEFNRPLRPELMKRLLTR